MDQWKRKIAFVSGASSGIGAEIARKLVEEGMIVVGVGRSYKIIEKMGEEYKNLPGKLYTRKMDLNKEEDIISAINWTSNNVGPISIFVNNAVVAFDTNLIDGNVSMWSKTLNGNIIGTTLCTKLVLRNMIDNNIDGHIVFIGDISCHHIYFRNDFNVYVASKCAQINLLEFWREELMSIGSKIKISIISPGLTKTAAWDNYTPEALKWFQNAPHLLPSDLADVVVFVITRPPHCLIYQIQIRPLGEILE